MKGVGRYQFPDANTAGSVSTRSLGRAGVHCGRRRWIRATAITSRPPRRRTLHTS